jgi:hypothetical protein
MEAPLWFLRELKAFDPDLRLRWSEQRAMWQLERKVRRGQHPGTFRSDSYGDDYIRSRDGFLLVGSISPFGLSRSIFEKLKASDLWSQGGWERTLAEIERQEARDEELKDAAFSRDMRDMSKDFWEEASVEGGASIYNSGVPE